MVFLDQVAEAEVSEDQIIIILYHEPNQLIGSVQ